MFFTRIQTSYGDSIIFSTRHSGMIAGLSFSDDDLVEYDLSTGSASLYFDGSTVLNDTAYDEDINAIYVLPNGNIILSTKNGASIDGLSFGDDDLVEYNPATGRASLYLDGSSVLYDTRRDEEIDAVHILPNGNIILSTKNSGSIDGLSFGDDDLVEYNPTTGSASLYFDGSTILYDTPEDEDIDAVHVLSNGNIILSTRNSGAIGGLNFEDDDLVEYDPTTGIASLLFDGSELLFDTPSDEDIDAMFYKIALMPAAIPEPETIFLIGGFFVLGMFLKKRYEGQIKY